MIEIVEMYKTRVVPGFTLDIRKDSRSKYKFEICISKHGDMVSYSCGGYNEIDKATSFVERLLDSKYIANVYNYCSGKGFGDD